MGQGMATRSRTGNGGLPRSTPSGGQALKGAILTVVHVLYQRPIVPDQTVALAIQPGPAVPAVQQIQHERALVSQLCLPVAEEFFQFVHALSQPTADIGPVLLARGLSILGLC